MESDLAANLNNWKREEGKTSQMLLMADNIQNMDSSYSLIKQEGLIEGSDNLKRSQKRDSDNSCDPNKNKLQNELQKQNESDNNGESPNISTSQDSSIHSLVSTPSKKVQTEFPSSLSLLQDDILFDSSEESNSEESIETSLRKWIQLYSDPLNINLLDDSKLSQIQFTQNVQSLQDSPSSQVSQELTLQHIVVQEQESEVSLPTSHHQLDVSRTLLPSLIHMQSSIESSPVVLSQDETSQEQPLQEQPSQQQSSDEQLSQQQLPLQQSLQEQSSHQSSQQQPSQQSSQEQSSLQHPPQQQCSQQLSQEQQPHVQLPIAHHSQEDMQTSYPSYFINLFNSLGIQVSSRSLPNL